MTPRAVKGVVFDMDGLLVDSEVMFRDAMMIVTKQRGGNLPLEVFLRMVGVTREQNLRTALDHFGEDFDYDAWMGAVWEHAHAQMTVDVALKAGVVELLDHLDALHLPRAIATSSSHDAVFRQLNPHDLLHRFGAVVANGDYARGKPFPDPFLAAAERLGVAPEDCLALEDSHNGVRAAHAAGMMTIMVPDLLEATEEMRGLCVAIADTLHDVRKILPQRTLSSPSGASPCSP
jgi:HAD superfamily hydrolase (TIGR01509 family)